jgi:transcriptional regulator with XRE-family HTH domain
MLGEGAGNTMTDVRRVWVDRICAERKARGWDKPEMARRLVRAAGDARSSLPSHESLLSYVKRWERGAVGISERYRLLYARAFDLPVDELFGHDDTADRSPWRVFGTELNDSFTPDDEDRLVLAAAQPSRIDAGVIGALSAVLAGQRKLEDAIGPAALLRPVSAQTDIISAMLHSASGTHRVPLARVVAEWLTFSGWLHAATRQDAQALALFSRAEEVADEIGYGPLAALATSFRGYVARQQGRPRAVVRAAAAAAATPGTHRTQQTFDVLQEAQARAVLGERETVRRMLDRAAGLAEDAGEPPPFVYWYTPGFFRLNIGLAKLGIGEYRDAADMIGRGLNAMPAEQRQAEWAQEYERAFADANDRG